MSFLLCLFFVLPSIVNNFLKFSARMTSYRNIRLNWRGTYGRHFSFIISPLLSVISLGLLTLVTKYYFNYYAKGHYYGTSDFELKRPLMIFLEALFALAFFLFILLRFDNLFGCFFGGLLHGFLRIP